MSEKNQTVVIFGASGHAKVVADILLAMGSLDIAGFIDDVNPRREGERVVGGEVLGSGELDALRHRGVEKAIVAIGDNAARVRVAAEARARGFRLVSAIHPRATVASSATIGEGSVVAAGAVVNPDARIGENVILNTACSVDHDCVVEDGAHVSPGAHLAGAVHVGARSWIGIGAVVTQRVRIGEDVVVGAGSVVLQDIPDRVVAWGVPAQVVKPNVLQQEAAHEDNKR